MNRSTLIVGLASLTLAAAAGAANIPGLYPTGSNGSGGTLGDGASDLFYSVLSSNNTFYNSNPQGTVIKQANIPWVWFPNTTSARWIYDNADGNVNPGATVTFRLTFNLTGYNPSTAVLFGASAADDTGQIFLNGNLIGNCGPYSTPTPFSANSGFLPAVNTLDFVVQDIGGAISGLIVPDIGGHVDKLPTPGAAALLGLGGLVASRRRRA
ncbi:MAG: MYXO-CTERM sorting domain-containing protein [Phycisphaerales bacterium]